jgi:hypothetical protein
MFKAGQSGNVKGRPQGAKDKAKADIKQAFQSLVEGNLSNIETWLSAVATKDPAKALEFMLRISEFIVPKMKAMELKTDFIEPLQQIIIVKDQETKDNLDKLKKQLNNN